MEEILIELKAEQESLDPFLTTISEFQWDMPSPAEGWSLRDSVAHLAHIDESAVSLLKGDLSPIKEAESSGIRFLESGPKKGRTLKPNQILSWWRESRAIMLDELSKCHPQKRLPWFVMPMGARAFATARLMETWAHGLDCYDTINAESQDTDRLRHIAFLAYIARPYAYKVNGFQIPEIPLRLELILPSGKPWFQGPEEAKDLIRGKCGEFCRVAVRRRHWLDMNLEVRGEEAMRFIQIVQTYAGPPGPGRKPKNK